VSGLTIGSVNKSLYDTNLDAAVIVGAVWRIPKERPHPFCVGERSSSATTLPARAYSACATRSLRTRAVHGGASYLLVLCAQGIGLRSHLRRRVPTVIPHERRGDVHQNRPHVHRMSDETIRPRGDHGVATVALNAHAGLRVRICAEHPRNQCHREQIKRSPDVNTSKWKRRPVKPDCVHPSDGRLGDDKWHVSGKENFIEGLGVFAAPPRPFFHQLRIAALREEPDRGE
jgi:hypothetical protein